jgi:pyruvate dehydrogenase phosphatase
MSNAFIVMGTDGLWEKLTNEEVVGLVGRFLDRKTEKPGWFGKSETFNVTEPPQIEGAKRPNGNGKRSRAWVWQDGNAATHLIRNALGGGNEDEVMHPSLVWRY